MSDLLRNLSITLVEPEYPVNVGYVARLAKNFGVRRVYFVNPKVDLSAASIYAAHGADVLDRAETVEFGEIRRVHDLLVATTAIRARRKGNLVRRVMRPERAASYLRSAKSSSLVLGREATGLTNDEIRFCDVVTSVDTGSEYPTMNVSHSLAILLYLASRRDPSRVRPPSRSARELFARNLHELAVSARFQRHRSDRLGEIAKRVAVTSQTGEKEMLLMAGIFRRAVQTIKAENEFRAQTRSKT
ncbi:MAG: RNA methyltransferase [Thaumarchaeota archaeon]|nr:MAG: RNA methyltransferase [Nitrososphaerota archaeon]